MPTPDNGGPVELSEHAKLIFRCKFIQHHAVHIVDVAAGMRLVGHKLKRAAAICVGDAGPIPLGAVPRTRLAERSADAAMPVEYRASGIECQRLKSLTVSPLSPL